MENIFGCILFFQPILMHCKYLCTLTNSRFATQQDRRSKFINQVSSWFILHINHAILLLGAFYFTLGNLSPKYRSKLTSIYLLALVKSSFISSYGMDAVLKPFIDDMKKLVCLNIARSKEQPTLMQNAQMVCNSISKYLEIH